MKHAKCRLCGERHPLGTCPSFVVAGELGRVKEPSDPLANELANGPEVVANTLANTAELANTLANSGVELANKLANTVNNMANEPVKLANDLANTADSVANTADKPDYMKYRRDPAKRLEYMRRYMRERRADGHQLGR